MSATQPERFIESARQHDRTSFFKYMPLSTAEIVLTNGTLRWSSPLRFNDPFDVPRSLFHGVTAAQMREAVARDMLEIYKSPPADDEDFIDDVRSMIAAAKRMQGQIDFDSVEERLLADSEADAIHDQAGGKALSELQAHWQRLLPTLRVLCLSEDPSHVAMWHHYADKYKGVVIEVRCIDRLDSSWLAARKVTYPTEKPAVYSAVGLASLLRYKSLKLANMMGRIAIETKSPDWSYEKEWRIFTYEDRTDMGDSTFSDYPFAREELASVYIGPLCEEPEKVLTLAATYPDVRAFKASVGHFRELEFEPIELN